MQDKIPPVDTNVWELSEEEREARGITTLLANLGSAVEALAVDYVVRGALGGHVFGHFVEAKRR